MNVFRYETPFEEINDASWEGATIFLAGPTVRGNQQHLQPSWRFEAIEIFSKLKFAGSLIVPEFADPAESDKDKDWIPLWEFEGLSIADAILFWVPRTKELIGLTTNWELGYWMGREPDRVIYGRPPEAYRTKYLDLMWQRTINSKIYETLQETCEGAFKLATSY